MFRSDGHQDRHVTLEYVRPGKGTTRYRQELVMDRPDMKILRVPSFPGPDITAHGGTIQAEGAPIYWFVFPGAWFDLGRFHGADGLTTGWYTNLVTPVTMRGDAWYMMDLFLDHWKPDSENGAWLDEDEFQLAGTQGLLEPGLWAHTARVHRILRDRIGRGPWPPAAVTSPGSLG